MKTKLLAMMLLAGGSMFAQTRFSVGMDFGGRNGGFFQAPPAYAYDHFRDDDRREFNRRFDDDRNRGFEQSRRGNRNRSNDQFTQGHDSENVFRSR
jgi:hypothetical protein